MDIQQLQAFVAACEALSFSMAAERLHLTQPAISKRITSLEHHLEARLFDRIGHRITLTEAGKALLPRARAILLAVDDSRRAIRSLGGAIEGRLALGTSHHIGLHRLPAPLREFTRSHPAVALDFRFEDSEVACEQVERGELELAIITLPEQASARLTLIPIWDDPLIFVAAPDHPLAACPSLSLEELARYPALLLGRNTFTWRIIEQPFLEKRLELRCAMSTNYLETLAMLASVGLGWSVLPAIMAGRLVKLSVDSAPLRRRLGIVYHQERTLSNAARAFIETVERYGDGLAYRDEPT